MLLLLRFFTFFTFVQNPKSRDFLRFFAVSRTFSRTMARTEKTITTRSIILSMRERFEIGR